MKKFAFPLERLRQWRARQLELEEEKLRMLQGELLTLDAARQRVVADEREAVQQVLGQKSVSAEEVRLLEQWRDYALREFNRLSARMSEVGLRLEEQRQLTIEAHRRLEAISHLRESQLEDWREDLNREEESVVNELVVSRWGHRGA